MTRLEKVIEQIKTVNSSKSRSWMYYLSGKLKENVITAQVIPFLEELKKYEINVSDSFIENFKEKSKYKEIIDGYTYNFNSPIDHDFSWFGFKIKSGEVMLLMNVHLFGDARGGFSDYFVVKLDSLESLYLMEKADQSVKINNDLRADLNIFSEGYTIYSYKIEEELPGMFFESDKDILLSAQAL